MKLKGFGGLNLSPAGLSVGSRNIHYAWVIVAIASVMGMIGSSIRFAASALVPYLESPDGFGWSYGAIAFAFSLQWLVLGIMSPYVGWLGDRYGIRRMMFLGSLLFIAGMLLTGVVTQLWQFYLFFGIVLGVATTFFTILPVSHVTLWFRHHLGAALGVVWASQGVGTVVMILLIALVLTPEAVGLKWIFWLPGIAGGAVMLMLTRPFFNGPAEIGLKPLGAREDEPVRRPQSDGRAQIRAKVFLQQAQRTGTFWNLIGIHFWGCAGHNIINVLLVAIAVDRGLSLEVAAGVFIAQQGAGLVTRSVIPVIAERVGSKSVWVICLSLQVLPLLLILALANPWAFFLFAILFGVGQGGEVPTFQIANRQYYGNVPQGSLYGWQNIGNGLGMGLGPLAGGFLWDITGSYAAPLVLSGVFSLGGVVSSLLLPSPRRVLTPNWEEALPPEARIPG